MRTMPPHKTRSAVADDLPPLIRRSCDARIIVPNERAPSEPKRWSAPLWYCADVGPSIGLLLFEDSMRRIDILEGFDGAPPIGTASRLGSDAAGLAVWRLTVRGADLGGRWIVIDRRFLPA
jgi:hypothetical protein